MENNNTIEKAMTEGDALAPRDTACAPLAEESAIEAVTDAEIATDAETEIDTELTGNEESATIAEDEALTDTPTVQTRVRPPLVLPEGEPAGRARPAVTEEDLRKQEGTMRARPAIVMEDIHTEREREIHNGRITGEKHATTATAAPVRTRTPEKNREVTNGIPVRHASHAPEVIVESMSEEQWKNRGRFTLVSVTIAALCVILMLTAVVVSVNWLYASDRTGPSDFDMNTQPEGEVPDIGDFGADGDETETATPPETVEGGESAESQTPPETTPPETAAPEVRYTVTIQAYNRTPITVTTGSMTVRELFEIVNFTLLENDRMYVELDSVIDADATIVVDTVEYRTVEKTEIIPYTSTVNDIQTIPRGEVQVARQGEDGTTKYTYSVEFVNGQEVSRTLISEVVEKAPVGEILERGVGGELVGADGITYSYSYYRVVPATYYNIEGLTWVGTEASENTVATNFDYIPLGTRLYVKNDKFDFGVRTVEDTGTMEGYEVDIWIAHDNPQLSAFAYIGYHYDMVIYYLD